jgi:hypothetical protein
MASSPETQPMRIIDDEFKDYSSMLNVQPELQPISADI